MKQCTKCGETKNLIEFGNDPRNANGKQSWCTKCQRVANKNNKEEKRVAVYEYLNTHPCVDCGETDKTILEFDHVRGTKVTDVSKLVCHGYSLKRIFEEIAKCEIRCPNCHKRKTNKQRGWLLRWQPDIAQ